jgi:hypothetical protein
MSGMPDDPYIPKPVYDGTITSDEAVQYIVGKMTEGSWNGNKESREMAAEWRKPLGWVKQQAATAARVVRGAFLADKETIRKTVLTRLFRAASKAEQSRQFSAMVAALREVGEVTGIKAASKIELSGAIAQMSTDDLVRQMEELQKRTVLAIAEKAGDDAKLLGEGGSEGDELLEPGETLTDSGDTEEDGDELD